MSTKLLEANFAAADGKTLEGSPLRRTPTTKHDSDADGFHPLLVQLLGQEQYCHLIVLRFFLGICEAPFFPGVFFLLSCWYTKKELALRYAVLYSGLVLATAVSGLLAAGIFAGLGGVAGLQGWRWLFILEGAVTFLLVLVAFVMLPDFPDTKSQNRLFTAEEKAVAVTRMARDAVSEEEHDQSVMHGLRLAVTDIKVWAFPLLLLSNQSAYGFNYFYPAIDRGFNLGSRTITLICTAPPYLLGAFIS
ncbi:hypothetical protein FPRO04_07796 [Fusarium proliferatum]|nr:hypothetical protein FPRO03_06757 [Fusarium proliferatum]KAG4277050.1 hypothetical protein FPRO04_07796 [Fusarium proliferatum]